MHTDRQLASWLVAHRLSIESAMNLDLGPAAPGPGSVESEALRRFRSFLSSALVRGDAMAPALDGLRLNERRVMALVEAWIAAAAHARETALGAGASRPGGADGVAGDGALRRSLAAPVERFRLAIRACGGGPIRARQKVARRAVASAIDRVADAFLAIDTDNGEIVDANPAAGALLGVHRDALLGVDVLSFVAAEDRAGWWTQLDAVTEANAMRSFGALLRDAAGAAIAIDATLTRFATRGRVLALLMARPASLRGPSLRG